MRYLYIFCLLLAIISNSTLLSILIRRKPRTELIIFFTMVLIFVIFWALCTLGIAIGLKNQLYEFLDTAAALGYTPLPVVFLAFTLSFSGYQTILHTFRFWFSMILPAIIFLYISLTTNLISIHSADKATTGFYGDYSPTGPLFTFFLLWFETLMFLSLLVLIRHYNKVLDPIQKKQTFWMIMATGIPLFIGSITDGILPILGYVTFPAAIPLTSITMFFTYIAIVKYGLFEIGLDNILSSISEGMITVDYNGNIIAINRAAQSMLNVVPQDALGKPFASVMILKDDDNKTITPDVSPMVLPIRSKKAVKDDRYSILVGRKRIPVSITASPILVQDKVIGATLLLRDISRQKEVDMAKNEFVSFASHQLANPLSVVKTYTELLLREKNSLQSKHRKYITEIQKSASKMTYLIQDFLNLSKIERHVIDIKPTRTNVIEILHGILHELERQVQEKHLLIFCRYKEGLTDIKVDPQIVIITLQNLLSNAVKYTPPNGKITISLAKTEKYLSFKISDTGCGIPQKEQSKVGLKLYRASNVQSQQIQGTGLGLYLVKTLLQKAGGSFNFSSAENKGSTFYITIPISKK